jgi:hypothetical protein
VYGEPLPPAVERPASSVGSHRTFKYVVGEFALTARDKPALFVASHPRVRVLGAARHHADDGFALLERTQDAGVAVA